LLKVVNDVARAAGDKLTTVLLALDISAAFDTVDFDILCDLADRNFGIRGIALNWLRSFVSSQYQYV
jgi:hypothetical protein